MQCVTPMIRMYQEYTFEEKQAMKNAGEKQFNKILPRSTVLEKLDKDENLYTHIIKKNEALKASGSRMRFGTIPCKKCWACRLNYSAEWATRIINEVQYYDDNYFVTLTYNPDNVPILNEITYKDKDGNDRTIKNNGNFDYSLQPKDVRTFINSLRKYFERQGHKGIKYYLAGEYGENGRPHYHIILINLPLDVKQFHDFHQDENLKMHWKSREIEKIWKKGIIDVAFVEWADAAYVARYGTKLFINNGTAEDYAQRGMVREFTRCSRNPAIGLRYCRDNEYDLLRTDKIIMKNSSEKTVNVKLPNYYMKKLEESYPEYIDQVKQDRQTQAIRAHLLKKSMTNVTDKVLKERDAQEIARRGGLLKRENIDRDWKDRVKISN